MQLSELVLQPARNLQYPVAVAIAIGVFAIVGLAVMRAVDMRTTMSPRHRLYLAPGVGMASVTLVATVISRYKVGISASVTWLVIFGVTVTCGGFAALTRRRRPPVDDNHGAVGWSASGLGSWLASASVVGFGPYVQLFLRDLIPAGYMTSATWTNNDLGVYLLGAANVQKAGIANAGLMAGVDMGEYARFDHPATHVLFSVVSGIFRTAPHKVGIVFMATAIGVLWSASVVVIEKLTERQLSSGRALLLSVMILNVGVAATVGNFFISQLVSIAYMMVVFGVVAAMLHDRINPWVAIVVAVVVLTGFVTSPEITVPFTPIVVLVCLLHARAWRNMRQTAIAIAVFILSVGVFAAFRYELLSSQFEVLTRTAGFAEAGWRSNFLSLVTLGGLAPGQYGGPYTTTVRSLDAVILVLGILWIGRRFLTRTSGLGVPAGILVTGLMPIVAASRWGVDAYRTWKLVVTCTPFFVLLVLALAWRRHPRSSRGESISIVACLVVLGASFSWTSGVWRDAGPTSYINSNLASLAATPEARRQVALNISVAPYFETMGAASLVGNGAVMASPSYFLPNGQPLVSACTLTTLQNLATLKKHGPVIAQRGNYVLVGTPRCG